MTDTLTGGCLCGALRYCLTLPVIDAGYCHCRTCQRASGAPALAWLTVPQAQFRYTAGTPAAYRSSARAAREFCPHCGTALVFRFVPAGRTLDVTLASLDDPARVAPQYHIWTGSRIAWFAIGDELPQYPGEGPDRHD